MAPCDSSSAIPPDGVHSLMPLDQMDPYAARRRRTYAVTPGERLIRSEFWLMPDTLEAWKRQGMPADADRRALFQLDPGGSLGLGRLGWTEPAYVPHFKVELIEDRGETEVERDWAGRHVLYFKGRRIGFMPEYIDHPLKDRKTWEEICKPKLNPDTPQRWEGINDRLDQAVTAAGKGHMICQSLAGAGMYLRSMIGPEGWLMAFYDMPEVVHDAMAAWLKLADAVTARHQQRVTFDEIFFAEDICYNHGPLIGPDTIREFFFPYYQQLLSNVRSRQIDKSRHLYVQVDTDGLADPVIDLYMRGVAMDAMSPFEVASGCDVVAIGGKYPNLVMSGGLDKRVIARGKADIDQMLQRILPVMRARGGYIPTLDHGTPPETPYENYLYFRKRCVELGG